MEAKHIEELRRKFRFIVNNIGDTEELCDQLLSLGVFDENYVEKILLKKPAPKEQTKELLYLLKFRGPLAYSRFISALQNSGNKHVADELMEPDKRPKMASPTQVQPTQVQPTKVQPSQAQPSQVQPSDQTPSVAQPSDNEDTFKSWPYQGKESVKKRKCTEEDQRIILSSSGMIYNITPFTQKGFVLRSKCQQATKNRNANDVSIGHYMDVCNTDLDTMMKFLDSRIHPKCSSKLVNNTAEEYQKKFEEIIRTNDDDLRNAGYFMMFCLSCGIPGSGYGRMLDTNQQCVDVDNIIKPLMVCEALKGKPKVIVVITIPDENLKEPEADRTETDAGVDHSSINEDDLFVFHVHHGERGPWIPGTDQMWFMQAFRYIIYTRSYNQHLLDLIDEVNELMRNALISKENKTRGHVGEVKVIQKDTRKKLYFFPGLISTVPSQASN
ncbi:caspase-2-like [Argopecten irradians]|uniref:caspase-2-like n=1 Tax=Argopecten irradians TaxID=31199 RepID=UPI003722920A